MASTSSASGYTGWLPAGSAAGLAAGSAAVGVDTVPDDTSAEAFFTECVSKRKPVVITGVTTKSLAASVAAALLSSSSSSNAPGGANAESAVQVEQRGEDGAYGRGVSTGMAYSAFLAELTQLGNDQLYLTSQPQQLLPESGVPSISAAPVLELLRSGVLPLRPQLLPTLTPSSVNTWIGATRNGATTSSGLHHDYHDNLYLLLNGRKRFRLFPPSDTEKLYPRGAVLQIHANGRINYVNAETAADGRIEDHHRHAANDTDPTPSLQQQRGGVSREDVGLQVSQLEEDEMREVIMLLHSMGEASISDEGEVEIDFNHLSDAALTALDTLLRKTNVDAADGVAEQHKTSHTLAARLLHGGSGGSGGSGGGGGGGGGGNRDRDGGGGGPPNHSIMPREVANVPPAASTEFPFYEHATELSVELEAGQMLYMPCGWWHEVTSEGNGAAAEATDVAPGLEKAAPPSQPKSQLHAAINYWFHPPDAASFASPYTNPFFEEAFQTAAREVGLVVPENK